jgi:hypothetical protein
MRSSNSGEPATIRSTMSFSIFERTTLKGQRD